MALLGHFGALDLPVTSVLGLNLKIGQFLKFSPKTEVEGRSGRDSSGSFRARLEGPSRALEVRF